MCRVLYVHDPDQRLSGLEMAERMFCGLSVLQHGGQDGGGIAYVTNSPGDGVRLHVGKFFGLVANQYDPRSRDRNRFVDKFQSLTQRGAFKVMGFLRYATAGSADDLINYPPIFIDELDEGRVVCAVNGDIPMLAEEREKLETLGVQHESGNDSEFMLRYVCYRKKCLGCPRSQAIHEYMRDVPGAYSGVVMTKGRTYLVRDPWGVRPLVVGLIDGRIIVAASESCALDILGAKFAFEVQRGEIVEISNDGTMAHHPYPSDLPEHSAHCIFELDYFASPVSRVFIDDRPFTDVRQKGSYAYAFGRQLANESPVDANFIASVPTSGDMGAIGYATQSGIPVKQIFIRNFSIPRTFIISQQTIRDLMVQLKLGLMSDMFRKVGRRRVCIVDDSIVRATTMQGIVQILRDAGAEQVHVRITYPPVTDPCFMGIAMPTKQELAASSLTVPQIKELLKVDSLGYLSPEGVATVMHRRGDDIRNYCTACYTGHYPFPVPVENG
ncbi:MAG: amidophosphoribosyltransferase [Patescibacteria group bacterium]|nr:amidophosphoribosyltransferase [Patescibacteria group bacterium]MDD5715876.1 amidophosphoribosyltransferase [Patescibacteria group bacterium]